MDSLSRFQKISIVLFFTIALGHRFIANDQGISLVPYYYDTIDVDNKNVGPFDVQTYDGIYYRHWLGTDAIGRDVLAGIIHGSWIALRVGSLSIVFSCLLGIFMAWLSAYFGDDGYRIRAGYLIAALLSLMLALFYFYQQLWWSCIVLTVMMIVLICYGRTTQFSGIAIPFDLIVQRLIELLRTIPDLLFVLVFVVVIGRPSLWNIILVISFLKWSSVTRLLRPEIIENKSLGFVQSAKADGISDFIIFAKYILPISLSTIIVTSSLVFAGAVLMESSLSFLGIGLPADIVTWGSLLSQARQNILSWWLALFPGLMIFWIVYVFSTIGDKLDDRLQGY